MRKVFLKDGGVEIPDEDEKFLDNILLTANVKFLSDLTVREFSNAYAIEKMFSEEGLKLDNGGTVRVSSRE